MKIHWRYDNTNKKRVRLWIDTWNEDQFELYETTTFQVFETMAKKFGFQFQFHDWDED